MKNPQYLKVAAAVAAALAWSSIAAPAAAQTATQINPGFVPDIGQINPGTEPAPPSKSKEVIKLPTPEEARAALMAPISRQPSTGDTPSSTTGTGSSVAQTEGTGGQAGEPPPSGPISSFGQTIPAKFSKRNDTLDRVPTMAWPLRLSDAQLKQIYDGVMADKSKPVAGADMLKPASELTPDQALDGMHPLPKSVNGIDGVEGRYYIKAKDKVFLVDGPTRTVVAEINQ